jgi:hypothetical protein
MSKEGDEAKIQRDQQINAEIEARDKKIQDILNGIEPKSGTNTSSSSVEAAAMPYYVSGGLFTVVVVILAIVHGLFRLHTRGDWKKLMGVGVFIIIYMLIVVFSHVYTFNTPNMRKLSVTTIAIVPVTLAFLLLRLYPAISSPFDNTIGYSFVKLVSRGENSVTSVMNNFKSGLFTSNKLDVSISYDWLLTTFSLENVSEMIDSLRTQKPLTSEGVVPDFYVGISEDAEYDEFKRKVHYLVDTKQQVGHFTFIYMVSILGLLSSLLVATKIK